MTDFTGLLRNNPVWSDYDRVAKWNCGFELHQIHLEKDCKGEPCVIHAPSKHDWDHLPVVFNGGSILRRGEDGTLYVDPDDYRFNQGKHIILRNSAHCSLCGKDIQSRSTHDFVSCSCPGEEATSVDGGFMYIRHLMGPGYEDTSIVVQKMLD